MTLMSFVRFLFNLNDLVPTEATPRRLARVRPLAIVALIGLFPVTFVEYQQAKFEPMIQRVTQQITESIVPSANDS